MEQCKHDHGSTQVHCCNLCGMPIEDFWKVNQWISVKDRLPEFTDEYNVVWVVDFSEPEVTTMEYDAKEKIFTDVMGFVNSDQTENVTHWQPLPPKP